MYVAKELVLTTEITVKPVLCNSVLCDALTDNLLVV